MQLNLTRPLSLLLLLQQKENNSFLLRWWKRNATTYGQNQSERLQITADTDTHSSACLSDYPAWIPPHTLSARKIFTLPATHTYTHTQWGRGERKLRELERENKRGVTLSRLPFTSSKHLSTTPNTHIRSVFTSSIVPACKWVIWTHQRTSECICPCTSDILAYVPAAAIRGVL